MSEQWSPCQLDEPDFEVLSETALAMAQSTIQNAIDQSGISRADLARSMDCSRSYVTRMLSGSHNLTIKTMARSLAACGYEIDFGLRALQWNWECNEIESQEYKPVPALEGTLVPASPSLAGRRVPSRGFQGTSYFGR